MKPTVLVYCVEMSHPEGTETEAVCATPEAARRWIGENKPDYVETRRNGDTHRQCPAYYEHTVGIQEREVFE